MCGFSHLARLDLLRRHSLLAIAIFGLRKEFANLVESVQPLPISIQSIHEMHLEQDFVDLPSLS